MNILLVEDEQTISDFLVKGLKEESFTVDHVSDGEEAVFRAEHVDYDLIILDVMLPKKNGIDVCKSLRKKGMATPVIMLTARITVNDKITGLDAGADDYITKPFSFEELLARIRAILRRKNDKIIELYHGDMRIDVVAHRVFYRQKEILFRPKEFALLCYLLRNKGRILSRTQILENIWGYHYDTNTNVVDVYIRFLREKLTPIFGHNIIRTVRGVGYMMEE